VGIKMRCIYFNGETCFAYPPDRTLAYKPNDEEKKEYCESKEFKSGPRLEAFVEYVQAIHSGKQK
jgi:hypothetical protein